MDVVVRDAAPFASGQRCALPASGQASCMARIDGQRVGDDGSCMCPSAADGGSYCIYCDAFSNQKSQTVLEILILQRRGMTASAVIPLNKTYDI